ncbi:hypothetical protein M2346_002451 [Sphingobium xanthum]|nr:hypothetical protein [Sphingobium sp. B10D3B]MCW2402431.1 hypothetical protein [Sphingobium sp. B10D7B]MCW2409410.1 hypothetical protein [Sphingobium xanthum]
MPANKWMKSIFAKTLSTILPDFMQIPDCDPA